MLQKIITFFIWKFIRNHCTYNEGNWTLSSMNLARDNTWSSLPYLPIIWMLNGNELDESLTGTVAAGGPAKLTGWVQ